MLLSKIITTSKFVRGVKYGWHITYCSSRPVSHQFLRPRAFELFPKVRHYSKFEKEDLSPLAKHLIDVIKISGPISIAHYMRQVLTNPLSGYYMKGDVFGVQGDFITSPEISQMFGELVGIWFLSQWMSLGRPPKTQIVEFGPGRGTLMDDMLRALSRFPDIYKTILGVHLIEASPGLREIQRKTLSGKIDRENLHIKDSLSIRRNDGIEVIWNEDFKDVPDNWSMIVAHEFFDALPVHKFENREYIDNKGQKKTSWRELRVDIDDSKENLNHFRLVVENRETDVSRTLTSHPRFDKFSAGDRIEVSLDSWNIMHNIAHHLNQHGGSALIIDYGEDFIQGDTLRAVKKHNFVNPMASPGEADLSADVDFSLLKDACNDLVSTFGPITQSHFLHSMGIQTRLEMLLKNARDEERKHVLVSGYQRLVDPVMMGKTYKVMAVAKVKENKIPIGFERHTEENKQDMKIYKPYSPLQPRLSHSPLQPLRPNHTRNFMTSTEGHRFTNRLSKEKSPYLLQHAHNPVDWYAWSEEAFAKARQENKPIFLSVGYSTCHWCHVMERESFENEQVAEIMNREFINIKVDREEQPGVDKVYMTFLQMTSGGGGWPMSVFLTPDLYPFYAGTYYPKDGFISVLSKISDIWKKDPNTLKESGQDVVHQIKQYLTSQPSGSANIDFSIVDKTFEYYIKMFDSTHGGFGGAPKFPTPTQFSFLFSFYDNMHISHVNTEEIKAMNIAEIRNFAQTLRIDLPDSEKEDLIRALEAGMEKKNSAARKALEMAEFTLGKIAAGGIHDHIGGGFHRYSTDNRWHVPHFEKMLYDQGQLLIAFTTAYSITKKEIYAEVAKDIIQYVSRDLCDPAGGFYSAEDADSYPYHGAKETKEGAFCVWTKEEIHELLPQPNASIFEYYFGIKENGNVLPKQDPHGELTQKNVLFEAYTINEVATEFNLTPEKVKDILRASKEELLKVRFERRPKPHCDDKILTSWNGLMISGLAHASQVLNDPSFLNLAIRAADFIKENLYNPNTNTLLRSFRDGPSDVQGFIDDYSYLIRALIDLYEASFNEKWLRWAFDLQEKQNELFWDSNGGGYFNVAEGDKNMLFRMKDEQDGAEPSANSVSAQNLLRLTNIIDEPSYQEKAEKTFTAFQTNLLKYPQSIPSLVTSLMTKLKGVKQIMLLGPSGDPTFESFCAAINAKFISNRVILRVQPGGILEEKNQTVASLLMTKTSEIEAHVCQNFACGLPIKDLKEFEKKLGS